MTRKPWLKPAGGRYFRSPRGVFSLIKSTYSFSGVNAEFDLLRSIGLGAFVGVLYGCVAVVVCMILGGVSFLTVGIVGAIYGFLLSILFDVFVFGYMLERIITIICGGALLMYVGMSCAT